MLFPLGGNCSIVIPKDKNLENLLENEGQQVDTDIKKELTSLREHSNINDILLRNEGDPIPLWNNVQNSSEATLNMGSVLQLWMLINHLQIQPDLSQSELEKFSGTCGFSSSLTYEHLKKIETECTMRSRFIDQLSAHDSTIEIAKIGNLILAADEGKLGKYAGKKLSDIDVSDETQVGDYMPDVDIVPANNVQQKPETRSRQSKKKDLKVAVDEFEDNDSEIDKNYQPTENEDESDESEEDEYNSKFKKLNKKKAERRRWTREEQKILKLEFNHFIRMKKIPRNSDALRDQELNETKQLYQIIQQKYTNQEKEIGEMKDLIQQLKDKNALLKAQKDDLTRAEAQIITQNDTEENKENNPSEIAVLSATVNRLNIDLQECRQIITNKDSEISRLQVQYNEANREVETLKQTAVVNSHSEVDTSSLEKEINKLKEEKSQLMERIKKSNEENLKAIDKYNKLEEEKKSIENDRLGVEDELDTLKKEQEDLLVLLADQDTKIDKYKTKLKELGEQVDDDDDDDDLGDDLDDEDEES
ncbi:unnamed protein product [Mytilus edulis]|uniref:Uso1/p115-like vesicle tethering protein C-terminal domain-containing protein n=1 Tax=Mytilus edulis TaxID=6550 RepID=A0A8S3RK91_MYTED|nr:unnamed protein product [Mytilus edulis]